MTTILEPSYVEKAVDKLDQMIKESQFEFVMTERDAIVQIFKDDDDIKYVIDHYEVVGQQLNDDIADRFLGNTDVQHKWTVILLIIETLGSQVKPNSKTGEDEEEEVEDNGDGDDDGGDDDDDDDDGDDAGFSKSKEGKRIIRNIRQYSIFSIFMSEHKQKIIDKYSVARKISDFYDNTILTLSTFRNWLRKYVNLDWIEGFFIALNKATEKSRLLKICAIIIGTILHMILSVLIPLILFALRPLRLVNKIRRWLFGKPKDDNSDDSSSDSDGDSDQSSSSSEDATVDDSKTTPLSNIFGWLKSIFRK